MKKLLIIIVYAGLLSACATQGQQAKTEGTMLGAGLGAAAGGLAGWAIGGSGTSAAIGAGVGAFLGGAGGYSYAHNIDKHHQELAGKENNLDAQIQFAKNVSSETQKYNQKLQTKIVEFNQDISSLETQAGGQENIKQKLKIKKQQISKEFEDAQIGLATTKKDLSNLETFRSTRGKQSKELDAEIMKLETSYKQLQQNSNALASLSQRI